MILADTSAWVEDDRATGSAADHRLATLIADDGPLMVTDPVLMEVLAGVRSEARQADLPRLLLCFGLVPFDAVSDFEAAARIDRPCRQAGVTPRGMVDWMLAAVAYRRGVALLSWDIAMDRVAQVIGEASPATPAIAAVRVHEGPGRSRGQGHDPRAVTGTSTTTKGWRSLAPSKPIGQPHLTGQGHATSARRASLDHLGGTRTLRTW